MRVNFILATLQNGGIGKDNELPWCIPDDLKFFRKMTMGNTIVMGYKTFESVEYKLFKGRNNYIISRDKSKYDSYPIDDDYIVVIDSFENILSLLENDKEVFVIGGEKTFILFEPYVKYIYLTTIVNEELNKIECDTYYEPRKCFEILNDELLHIYDDCYISKLRVS